KESGDREGMLARLRTGLAGGVPVNHAHPAPDPLAEAPEIRFRVLDGEPSLVEVFTSAAIEAAATVHRDLSAVADVVERHSVRTAVATAEPEVADVVTALRDAGVELVDDATRADLGVTSCRAAIAVTGSVVIGSDVPVARWASLMPRVHLCVVPTDRVVARPADVLRGLDREGTPLPANLVLISGPSRTGDIEQLLTLGVHGPVAVELLVR
ncbi:MAG: LutC/YkgG family protein, partial [Acidimicrobiales bacterium]